MTMKRKTILVLASLVFLALPVLAGMDSGAQLAPQNQNRLLTVTTDEAASWWMIWWVDAGNISDFLVSNTLQGGTFARHALDEHEYRGELAFASIGLYPATRGRNAEYPKGSEQFYTYAWGLWVGSHYRIGDEMVYNVSKGAFNSDIGAMAAPEMEEAGGMRDISNLGLYFSDMTIPEGYGYDGEGGRLFATPGTTPLDYQVLWPFTDTTINKYRRAIKMPDVSPENGDIISEQDSYACGGDWIPVNDATCIWILATGAYDLRGQGLRIEQRTYAWNYEYNDSYIFINYKIRNMNDFPLDSVYFSFFMDNDIGEGGTSAGDPGFWDDLIGFDEGLNMGYTYDSDGSEEGWVTPAGYIGAVFLDTPLDIGLTGFETWQNGHEIDELGQDSLKYAYMASTDFVTWENPNDVRMLMNCGPYSHLEPDEEVELTVAVIVAYSFDELKEKAKAAKIQFENGYFGYAPPPNPSLSVIPGDSVVYLTWGSEPEHYVDPMSGQPTFEGYRVYKSLSGLAETWQLLGDYDLKDSKNPDTAVVEHTSGPSKANIEFLGVYYNEFTREEPAAYGFEPNTYTLTFQQDEKDTSYKYYIVYDVAAQNILTYNPDALTESGYCVLDKLNGTTEDFPAAVKAKGKVTFTPGPGDTLIPKGTIVATDADNPIFGYVEFETTQNGTIDPPGTPVDVDIEARVAGTVGNVTAGQITTIVKPGLPGVTVTNADPITGGVDGPPYYPYESGDIIFIDGGQYCISDADSGASGDILEPIHGEVFTINTYVEEQLGGQAGVRHYYVDEDVHNGQIYYYSVSSYSKPQPTEGVESLEGGKTGKTYWAVPRSNPMGWQDAMVGPVIRVAGDGSALVKDSLISPDEITGHEYEVGFRAVTRIDTIIEGSDVTIDTLQIIKYAYFKDVIADSLVLDSFLTHAGELSGPIIDGVLVQVASVSIDTLDVEELIDTLQTGWLERPSKTDMYWNMDWTDAIRGRPVPYTIDYLVTVVDSAQDGLGRWGPVVVNRYDNNEAVESFLWNKDGNPNIDRLDITGNTSVSIYWEEIKPGNEVFKLFFVDTATTRRPIVDTVTNDTIGWDTTNYVIPPETGDKFLIKTLKATTEEDRFRYNTFAARLDEDDTTQTLDDVRVVPNPYYVRAPWDRSQYDRHVIFQGLPLKCSIRIFNSAGLLIRTIEHDGEGLYGTAGSEEWNLLTDKGLDCTSGLYIWQVEMKTSDGKKKTKVGKFAIIR
jgi:hypothetical protein